MKGSKERSLLEQEKTSKFSGNPLCQATKQQLNVKNDGKGDEKLNHLSVCFWLSYGVFPVQCLEECCHDNDV